MKSILFVTDVTEPSESTIDTLVELRRDKNRQLLIVCQEATQAMIQLRADGFSSNIHTPGCPWLPLNVTELDAVSYLAKKDVRLVLTHDKRPEGLTSVFSEAARARRLPLLGFESLLRGTASRHEAIKTIKASMAD